MKDKTYNGWTNYATWRIALEIFDTLPVEDISQLDTYETGEYLKELAEEIVTNSYELLESYAFAFLSDVNWHEIAQHKKEEY